MMTTKTPILLALAVLAASAGCDRSTAPSPAREGAAPALSERWRTDLGTRVEAAPTVDGATVYVVDAGAALHALDLPTGKLRWRYPAAPATQATSGQVRVGAQASPTAAGGLVLFGDTGGTLHAVDAVTGEPRWTATTAAAIKAPAAVADGLAIVVDESGIVYAFAADGRPAWVSDVAGGQPVLGGLAVRDGTVLFAGCDAILHDLSLSDGTERRAVEIGTQTASRPVVSDGRAVLGTQDGRLVAYDLADGSLAWSFEDVEGASSYASPAEQDGVVVTGLPDNRLLAVRAGSGETIWTSPTRAGVNGAPAIRDGRVYAATEDGRLYLLDLQSGRELATYLAGGTLRTGPAVGAIDGRPLIVLADDAGAVYCLE